MRGSVRQRRRGVWEVRIYLGRDSQTGQKRYLSRTVRGTKRDAEQVSRDLAKEHQATEPDESPEYITVAAWLDSWWDVKQRDLSPNTVSSWRSSVETYLKPELGDLGLHELRGHHLESLYRRLVDDGLSPARVQKVHTVASVAFKAAVRRDLIAASPAAAAVPPVVQRPQPSAPTAEEVSRLIVECADDLELQAFLVVAANTGARRSEVCALRWCDLDLEGRAVAISRTVAKGGGGGAVIRQTKTGASNRVAISTQAARLLGELVQMRQRSASAVGAVLPADAFVWSQDVLGARPVYPDTITSRFNRLRSSLGLSHVQLRHFRHFAATQLLSSGVDVRTVAGRLRHARPATTLDRYAAWVPARDRDAADALDNLGE